MGLEPVEMIEGLSPVKFALGVINAWATCGLEIGRESLSAILKSRSALRIGSTVATNVDFTTRQAGCATAA